ncbi:MAG: hypothetical protein JO187_10790 [Acidobacteria bacterium]|nr:hypothetical protein [Acidobacteriota bacterium]
MDILLLCGKDATVELAIALPTITTYMVIAQKLRWLALTLPFRIFWVNETGVVTPE